MSVHTGPRSPTINIAQRSKKRNIFTLFDCSITQISLIFVIYLNVLPGQIMLRPTGLVDLHKLTPQGRSPEEVAQLSLEFLDQ